MSDGQATAQKSGGPDPLIGRVIADRFKIVELIARGGMGKVYRAEQAPLGRACAVKILNPNYNGDADPEFHRRFFREASITSQISHPNSVTIFDYGKTDDEIYYMAMEYLEGQTLHQAIRDAGTLSEERTGRIAQQICRALREAHALSVIHRDLKPANIFLTRHGDDGDFVKVLDFGLVKHLSERPEEQLTQTGLFMGSPKYMAPEQIQGAPVDARTDVYSLGIIMYEMLAGKVPFERATSVNILMAHVGEPPPPMREVNRNIVCSPVFEELVMRCIAKDPRQRFGSMDEVLQAIKRAHGGSMTGMVAAAHANATGQFYQAGGGPPPPVAMATPSFTPSGHPSMSGALTPMGVLRPDASFDLDSRAFAPRRSRAWILLGVLVAAVVGGGLGMIAFRMTAPASVHATATTATEGAAPPATAPKPTASAIPSAEPERTAMMHVTTDPPGASVHEDAIEHCAATPCDVTFKGDDANPEKVHKLLVSKAGYKPETRAVKSNEPAVTLKLTHLGWKHVPPPTPGAAQTQSPSTAPPKPTGDSPSTPNGFKDLPY